MRNPMQMRANDGERGSALLITTMVAVILTLLGLAFLTMADQENSIALNQRDSDQLLWVGEAGARMVKAWFDRPTVGDPNVSSSILFKFMGTYDMRLASRYDRTQRLFDNDGDPNTPDVLADGSAGKPYFRQGLPVGTGSTYLTFWDKPYRGSNTAEFRGEESGPDVVMNSDTSTLDNLDLFNRDVIGDLATQQALGRVQKIEFYAPPIMMVNGVRTRYGICTVKVTSAKFKNMGTVGAAKIPVLSANSVEVGRRVVKMVLNETPYPGPGGPFQTCSGYNTNGTVNVHWGETDSQGIADLGGGSVAQLQNRTAPGVPYGSVGHMIAGPLLNAWVTKNNGNGGSGFDPWYRFRVGQYFQDTPDPNVIFPFPYTTDPNLVSFIGDDSNLFQLSPPTCPSFDYQIWKNVAISGGQDIHYLVWDGVSGWKEDGLGASKDVGGWTNGQEGFWFFDTTDRLPPSGTTNLTPAVQFSGGWSSAGFIYLNGDWDSAGTGAGVNRVIIPPGEPWNDVNADKVADPNGEYFNLTYPTALGGNFTVRSLGNAAAAQTGTATSTNGVTYTYTTDPNARDSQGIPFTGQMHFQGVIFAAGTFQETGSMAVFGSIVIKGASLGSGSPDVYFDERLIKGGFPPPELNLPRTTISVWQSDM